MSISTFLPPLIAVPVADAVDWRFSLGVWGVFAIAGVIPWVLMLVRGRTDAVPEVRSEATTVEPAVLATGPISVVPTSSRVFGRLIRLPLAWALAVVFSTSSIMAYVSFAWLPSILTDIAGVSASTAGLLLSLFAFMGLPAALIVPVLVVRFQATRPLFLVAVTSGIVGLVGLLLWPGPISVWLWVTLFGVVGAMFPLALVLISVRARTPESAVALSSFVQSAGYVFAAAFPFTVGVLHDATDSWTIPLLVIIAVLVVSVPFGLIAGRRRTVEDEWEHRRGRW
jgi:CP family cyanate transporter-like MFS transporter